GPFDLELEFVTSARDEELPRCLTISCFGWHVAFLGRLIRNGGYRHLPLHGLERAVPEMLRFDRVAVWSGDLSGVEDAFLPLEKQPEFQLESGKRYRIRIGIDSARGTLTLAVDGKVILTREGLRIQSLNRHLALREAMPHRLESLQFSGALRDD
ncbi:MAG: hypothetical protein KDB53_13935, partial [Planctomycetes bacterium]|nr:hypothetical protein [Planctomycetota bacterium]